MRLGLERSARLAAQRHAHEAAAIRVERASALPDPKLRLGIENLPAFNAAADDFRYDRDFMTMRRIGLMQEFPSPAKRHARAALAAQERELQDALAGEARREIERDIRLAWQALRHALRGIEVIEVLEAAWREQRDALGPAIVAGRAGAAELMAIDAAIESVRDRAAAQARAVERARVTLAAWIGDAARRPLKAPQGGRSAIQMMGFEQNAAVLDSHPALEVARRREALARAALALEQAAVRGDWSLELGYSQRRPSFSNMVSVMVSIDLPVDRPARQDRDIAARMAEVERARADTQELARRLRAEWQGLVADLRYAEDRVRRHAMRLLPLARERAEALLASYRAGRGTLEGVLEARRVVVEGEIALIAAESERDAVRASLSYFAPGGGTSWTD